jgi:hypothetical protein
MYVDWTIIEINRFLAFYLSYKITKKRYITMQEALCTNSKKLVFVRERDILLSYEHSVQQYGK